MEQRIATGEAVKPATAVKTTSDVAPACHPQRMFGAVGLKSPTCPAPGVTRKLQRAGAVDAARNGLEVRPDDGKAYAVIRKERRLVMEVAPQAENTAVVTIEGLGDGHPLQRCFRWSS